MQAFGCSWEELWEWDCSLIKFNILRSCSAAFQSICMHFVFSSSVWRLGVWVFLCRHSGGRVVVAHCGSDWHLSQINGAKHLFRYLHFLWWSVYSNDLTLLKSELFIILLLSLKWGGSVVQIIFIPTDFFFCTLFISVMEWAVNLSIHYCWIGQFLFSFCQSFLLPVFWDNDKVMEVGFPSAMLGFALCLKPFFAIPSLLPSFG